MRSWRRRIAVAFAAAAASIAPAMAACPPQGWTRDSLLRLKAEKFQIVVQSARDAAAEAMLACLDDPDPAIRDGVVFEGASIWLRASAISRRTMRRMTDKTMAALSGPEDLNGFRRPFAALILSELVRSDRIEPYLDPAMRAEIVRAAAAYLSGVADYRGFDPKEGWRHGVAHGADLALQLSVNPAVGADGLKDLMAAVRAKIAPADHAYDRGESARLASALYQAYRRGVLTAADWDAWFAEASAPAPMAGWGEAFASVEGLNRRHNAAGFFQALLLYARVAKDEGLAERAQNAAIRVYGG